MLHIPSVRDLMQMPFSRRGAAAFKELLELFFGNAKGGKARPVLAVDMTAPRGTPIEGDTYLLLTGNGTGAWAGALQFQMVEWTNAHWAFGTPDAGALFTYTNVGSPDTTYLLMVEPVGTYLWVEMSAGTPS